jgi:predicted DNA-binding transcriptional regulator
LWRRIARIRREFYIKGKAIREIVRDLGVSRNTVHRAIMLVLRRQDAKAMVLHAAGWIPGPRSRR